MGDMYVAKVLITPAFAEAALKTNPRNRSIKKDKIRRIAREMVNGEFELTHQCIAFDENGMLIDGHHRLSAVVATGCSVEMLVMYNAPNSTKIDIGAPRTERDSLYMASILDKNSDEWNRLTLPLVNIILRRNYPKTEAQSFSALTKHKVYLSLKDHINTILHCLSKSSKGKARSALILYAMLCAEMAGVPEDTLKAWHKIASTGDFYVDGDDLKTRAGRSVLLFKNYVENHRVTVGMSAEKQDEVIKRAESSIKYYNKLYPNSRLYGEFVYPEVKIDIEI